MWAGSSVTRGVGDLIGLVKSQLVIKGDFLGGFGVVLDNISNYMVVTNRKVYKGVIII